MNAKIFAKLFHELANELENLSESDIKKLESGNYSLGLKVLKKAGSKTETHSLDDNVISEVLNQLNGCESRELGLDVLNKYFKNKKELEWFAKQINVYVMKQDKVDKVREKIIEGTIGATLRSSAIQRNES